jgi:exosortase N
MYVIIPLNLIVKWLFAYTKSTSAALHHPQRPVYLLIFNSLLCMGVLLTGLQIKSIKNTIAINPAQYTLAGYNKEMLPSGVIKFVKEGSLVYVKPIAKQYGIEHNPMVCWQGSGYDFKNVNTLQVKGIEIYIGELIKDDDIIYTAWWFDNGNQKTINPLNWRWKVLKGEDEFSLINVNTSDKDLLLTEIEHLFQTKFLVTN